MMKTLINFAITALIIGSMISKTQAGDNEKFYQVTQDGQFKYIYRQADEALKDGEKPITTRTFYLETVRKGLLPQELSYNKYLTLTPEEIQSLLDQAPLREEKKMSPVQNQYAEMENSIEYSLTPNNEETTKPTQSNNTPESTDELFGLPWIIEASVNPTNGYELPDEFKEMERCSDCEFEVPQVVNDLVAHGQQNSSNQVIWVSEDKNVYTVEK